MSTDDPFLGMVLDTRYRLVALVARGGMGRVYRAETTSAGEVVAVKVLDLGAHEVPHDALRARFVREAATGARLAHAHTVRLLDAGRTADGVHYIAMEYLEGRNLFQVIGTDAPMHAPRVARIGRQVAAALGEAHGHGLLHRDLKPSNVLLTRSVGLEEIAKVVDFGLAEEMGARTTHDDAFAGSPSYMSPEQIRSEALDARSDLYSLGAVLYACLTGRSPFVGGTSRDILWGHLHEDPPPMREACPSMKPAPALEAVVRRCLAKAPGDRYASMDELVRALEDGAEPSTEYTFAP